MVIKLNKEKQKRNNTSISNNLLKSGDSDFLGRLRQFYRAELFRKQFYLIQFYKKQFFRKYRTRKVKAASTINLLLVIFLIISQFSSFAYIDIEGENLPPFAALDLLKRTAIDINIANDGTTGHSTSTLNSKINEILKTKLAQKGIDYKLNIIDSYDRIINSSQSELKEVNFDTGKIFYPQNKIGPFGADFSKISGGIKGKIVYTIEPNKIKIKSFNLDNEAINDNTNCANERHLYINFYSDYEKNKLIGTKDITWSQIGRAKYSSNDSDNSSGSNIEIDFSSNAKAFSFRVDGFFTISAQYGGNFSYSLMQDGKNELQWLRNMSVFTENIKRKAFISENISDMTWRQGTEKYYVDFSNREFSENTYTEGKASSLLDLLDKNINLIKLGNSATKEAAMLLINENNNNGSFIDNKNLDTAINELANYILLRAEQRLSSKLENGSYVVVSENELPLEFEAGGLNDKTGVQCSEPSAIRTKEYIEVNSGGTYSISENNSGIDYVNLYFYQSNLSLVSSPAKVATNNRFTIPVSTAYIKLTCPITDVIKANRMTIIENSLNSGERLEYKPSVIDNENDPADIMFRFDHDNKNIAGDAITNQAEKSVLSGIELSAPMERFTRAGTYQISMYAKDIPKQIGDATNLLQNGAAEIIDVSGKLSGWTTWAENSSITAFGMKEAKPYIIAGNNSFEISTEKQELIEINSQTNIELTTKAVTEINSESNATSNIQSNTVYSNNSACYYQDISATPNTGYKLSGLMAAYNCFGNFVIYEMDDNFNIIKYHVSNETRNTDGVTSITKIGNPANPQTSSVYFTTGFDTTRLRIHIVKSENLLAQESEKDYISNNEISANKISNDILNENRTYLFADNITFVKLLPNSLFNNYRKTSTPATTTIYAHRLPRAEFTYQIENYARAFKIMNLADNQLSFDPDHTDKENKGIINHLWRWAEITSGETTWHDGKVPESRRFPTDTQVIIWYKVQDSDGLNGIGEWSLPKVVGTDGSLAAPSALFVATPNPLPMQNELVITDQSYSPNYGGIIESRNWTIKKLSTGKTQKLDFDRIDTANSKYYKKFAGIGFGQYTITLIVTDNYGKVSKPYSKTITVIDTIKPTVSVSQSSGTFNGERGAEITVACADCTLNKLYNRGLKTISYVWSKNSVKPQNTDTVQTINIPKEGVYTESFVASQTQEGIWYLYLKDEDYAGNLSNNENYTSFGPYTVEKIKAGNFFITMMLDIGWREYYFDINNGIDDNHDGVSDRYLRRNNTDIGTIKMPINYYSLVGFDRTYIKAGYKVKGKIDIVGDPDYAKFNINYIKGGKAHADTVLLSKANGNTYTFECIIPLETDNKTFISFDLITKKGSRIYGNEKWLDTWDQRNKSRLVFYVKGKATEDLNFIQSH